MRIQDAVDKMLVGLYGEVSIPVRQRNAMSAAFITGATFMFDALMAVGDIEKELEATGEITRLHEELNVDLKHLVGRVGAPKNG